MTVTFCTQTARDRFALGIAAKKPFPPHSEYWTTSNPETERALRGHFDLEGFPSKGLSDSALDSLYSEIGQLLLKLGPSNCQIASEILSLWAFVETSKRSQQTVYIVV